MSFFTNIFRRSTAAPKMDTLEAAQTLFGKDVAKNVVESSAYLTKKQVEVTLTKLQTAADITALGLAESSFEIHQERRSGGHTKGECYLVVDRSALVYAAEKSLKTVSLSKK